MSRPVRAPLLGELETVVMSYLWDGGEGEVKAVHEAVGKNRGITLNTIQSTLKRLFEKGLLERDKVSHAHVYRAKADRAAFNNGVLAELVSGMLQGHADAVVSTFVDLAERAGPQHLELLEALVVARRRELERKRAKR